MPMPRLGFVAIPQPDPLMEDVHLQPAFGTLAQGHPLPGLGGLLGGPMIDPDRRGLGDGAGRGPPARRGRRGHARLGIVQVEALVFMNIAHEDLTPIVERPQHRRIAALPTIKAHPGQADPLLAGMGDHRQGQVVLALEAAVRGRYPRRLTALRILGPRFR